MNSLDHQRLEKELHQLCLSAGATPNDYTVSVGKTHFNRLFAILTWNKFDAMEITARQKYVWEFIDNHFNPAERAQISMIFTRGVKEAVVEEEIKAQESSDVPWL